MRLFLANRKFRCCVSEECIELMPSRLFPTVDDAMTPRNNVLSLPRVTSEVLIESVPLTNRFRVRMYLCSNGVKWLVR